MYDPEMSYYLEDTKVVYTDNPAQFKFRPDKGHKRIQKIALWVLDKIGAYGQTSQTKSTANVVTLNIGKIQDEIATAGLRMMEEGKTPYALVVGREMYYNISNAARTDPLGNNPFSFDTERYLGMKIIVVPTVNAFFILSKRDCLE